MIDGWDGFDGWDSWGGFDGWGDSGGWGDFGGWGGWGGGVDIGGYWGGWEGGVVVESGWGSVPLGGGISYGGGYGGSLSSDLGFDWGRETLGLGEDAWRRDSTRVCVQGGVAPKCPEGQEPVWDQNQCKWVCQFTTACLYRVGTPPACPEGLEPVWNPVRCKWVCEPPARLCAFSLPPGDICPGGANPVWDRDRCTWVCPGGGSPRWPVLPLDDGGGGGGGGDGGKTPLDRVADVIERILAGGGGGVIIPQIPQPQAVVAPATERRYNPAAIVLLLAGLALGGYYVYQRTRRS